MSNFVEVGRDNADPKMRRAFIVKEAIEIFKVFLTAPPGEMAAFVESISDNDIKKNIPLPENQPIGTNVFIHETKFVNIIKFYADWIEEALEIKPSNLDVKLTEAKQRLTEAEAESRKLPKNA